MLRHDHTRSNRSHRWTSAFGLTCLGVLSLLIAPSSQAISVGSQNDFSVGTEGWSAGNAPPFPPTRIANGGIAGVGDAFLEITGTGAVGAGSKISAFNQAADWVGDYTSAGVASISLYLNAFPLGLEIDEVFQSLFIRIGIEGAGGEFVSSAAVELNTIDTWVQATFELNSDSLTWVSGISNDLATTLAGVTRLRIFHNPSATSSTLSPRVAGRLGVDSIGAAAVPEPGVGLLLGFGLAMLGIHARNRPAQTTHGTMMASEKTAI